MAFLKKEEQSAPSAPQGFEALYTSFLKFLDNLGAGKRTAWAVVSLIIAAALITLASVTPLLLGTNDLSLWVSVLIGFPAGVLVFGNFVGLVHFTGVREWGVSSYKDRRPQTRRIRDVALWTIAVVAVLIAAGGHIPRGVGGVVVITLALFAYNIIRRTPEELKRAQLGLPDPRDITEEDS
jgi:hypothetical protein